MKQSIGTIRNSWNFSDMKNMKICTCSVCQAGKYKSEDYYVDMSFLKKERPIGVSGLLRVKNDADFLSDCIDSCIDALDELVVCYQDCEDNAVDVIHEKKLQYPDKIKVYYYAPPVYCWGLTEDEIREAFALPDSSVHKLCNYYNYTLSKATYRYAVKIDSDQIYYPDKLKKICDAYRNETYKPMTFSDYWGKYYFKIYTRLINRYSFLYAFDLFGRFSPARNWIMKRYMNYLIKEIENNKYAVSLLGMNVGYKDGKWGICILDKFPFNGEMDHLVFRITEQTYYQTFVGLDNPMERLLYRELVLPGGWFWFHLKGTRKGVDQSTKEWVELGPNLKPERYSSYWRCYKSFWLFFWAYEKDIPEPAEILKQTTCNLFKRDLL